MNGALRGTLGFACFIATGCTSAVSEGASRWLYVIHDAAYDVAIDTASILQGSVHLKGYAYRTADVWYRTDHKQQRLHKGEVFDREVVHSLVRCDNLSYKVMSVDLSLGDGRPISRQRLEPNEIELQIWHAVETGTADDVAAREACRLAQERRPSRR